MGVFGFWFCFVFVGFIFFWGGEFVAFLCLFLFGFGFCRVGWGGGKFTVIRNISNQPII